MKIEANYVSIVFVLIIAMLLTSYFVYLINNSVESTARLIKERNGRLIDCVYKTQYNYTKVVLINRTCIGEILYISVDNGIIHHSDEYVWIKTDPHRDIKIVTGGEVIVV